MGTITFKNNQKYLANRKIHRISEYPLFTDAPRIIGEISNSKKMPYAILNPIIDYSQPIVLPRIILRVFDYIDYQENVAQINKIYTSKSIKSNFETYTSLNIQEEIEITAILSLILGIRLKAGKQNRSFEPSLLETDNYFGSILNINSHENPLPVRLSLSELKIPNAMRFKSKEKAVYLNKTEKFLAQLVKIKDKNIYAAIVKSAKLYSNALWICETDPENAWLLLVSAIETAASFWKKEKFNEVELLRSEYKDLADLIDISCSDSSVMKEVAKCLHLRSAKKFVDFIKTFYRKPMNSHKNKLGKINWDNFDTILKKIYNLRSLALHTGQPFPPAMCEHPFLLRSKRTSKIAEKPISNLSFIGETVIKPEDQPMLLWKFEEIVRKALLKWLLTLKTTK